MKKPQEIVVKSCKFIDERVIEVEAFEKRLMAPRIYTVHFDRRGAIKFGHLWVPDYDDSYLVADAIPMSVRQAAIIMYRKDNHD
jgi:hypothetical protein